MDEELDPQITEHFTTTLRQVQWQKGTLQFKLDDLQRSISAKLRDLDFNRAAILSSRQIGKSFWNGCHALEYLLNNPNRIARIVAPTLDQCSDIVQDNLQPIIADAPQGFIERKKTDYRWDLYNGSSLRLGGLKRAHVDSNRGGNASLVIYEECGFVAADDFSYGVNSVLGPQLLRSAGREIFVTSPSEDPDHPLHTIILPECIDIGTAFVYSVFHSPSITDKMILEAGRKTGSTLTLDFIAEVRGLSVITTPAIHALATQMGVILSEAFRREYMAEIIRSFSLMVIPHFESTRHVRSLEMPSECTLNVTLDMGGVRDLTVALLHTYDWLTNQDYIFEEKVFPANTPTHKIVESLREWDRKFRIANHYADVPGQTQVDLSNPPHDYLVSIPQKSDWLASVNTMSNTFSTDRILIDPRCKFLIKSCRAGMFNKIKTNFNRSEELGHCDALAALMYAIRSQEREAHLVDHNNFHRSNFYIPPIKNEHDEFAQLISPKRFGKFK